LDDLESLANFSEIIGTVFVIGGVIFAIAQIRQIQRQRKETAAIEMMRAWQNPDFSRSFQELITSNASQSHELDLSLEKDAYIVFGFLESVGVMVNREILSGDIAFDLVGGTTIALWERYLPWVQYSRTNNPRAYEWVEWLYDDFVSRSKN